MRLPDVLVPKLTHNSIRSRKWLMAATNEPASEKAPPDAPISQTTSFGRIRVSKIASCAPVVISLGRGQRNRLQLCSKPADECGLPRARVVLRTACAALKVSMCAARARVRVGGRVFVRARA